MGSLAGPGSCAPSRSERHPPTGQDGKRQATAWPRGNKPEGRDARRLVAGPPPRRDCSREPAGAVSSKASPRRRWSSASGVDRPGKGPHPASVRGWGSLCLGRSGR